MVLFFTVLVFAKLTRRIPILLPNPFVFMVLSETVFPERNEVSWIP